MDEGIDVGKGMVSVGWGRGVALRHVDRGNEEERKVNAKSRHSSSADDPLD